MSDEATLAAIQSLAKSNEKLAAQAAAGQSSGGNGGILKSFGGDIASAGEKASSAGGLFGKAGEAAVEGYKKLEKGITENLATFRDLSKSGASFSNDIVGMSVAAAGTRMSMDEFAGTIKENAAQLSGLGGNVTRGAEAFAKMSKDMFDNLPDQTDALRQMGYTTKDLNDVLALQVGFQGATLATSERAQKAAQESALQLATEMDELAKLTGKSRKEQEDAMKKAAADMQVEAKMRILTAGKSEEEAAKMRSEYLRQYNEANARGQGQMFKEVFATGTVQSKEASMQVALQGKAASATVAQASSLSKGQYEAAAKANERANVEMAKLNNNTAYLSVAMMGTGEASKSVQTSMTATSTQYKNESAVRQEMMKKDANFAKMSKDDQEKAVQAELQARAKAAQQGKDGDGKDVSGATKAVINLGARVGDANSAIMNGLVKPLNEKVAPSLNKFADTELKAGRTVRNKDGTTRDTTFGKEIESQAKEGFQRGVDKQEGRIPEDEGKKGRRSALKQDTTTTPTGSAAGGIGEALGRLTSISVTQLDKLMIGDKVVPQHAEGGHIPKPELAMIGEAGPEFVLNEPQMKSLIDGIGTKGIGGGMAASMAEMQKANDKNSPEKMMSQMKDITPKGLKIDTKQMESLTKDLNPVGAFEKLNSTLQESNPGKISAEDMLTKSAGGGIDIAKISSDIGTSFSAAGSAMTSPAAKAQAAIDEAIKRKEEAQEKLNKLWNEGSDDELNENHEKFAQELKDAKENLSKVIDDSMSGLVDTFDDAGEVMEDSPINDVMQSASPKANPMADLDTSGIVLGPNGMPVQGSIKAKAASIPAEKQAEDKKKADAKKAEDKKAEPKKEEAKAAAAAGTKQASLDDVVKSLESLNKTMNRLLATSEDLGNKQVKATKSVAASGNVYAR